MKCIVSSHIIDLKYPIRFMYKETPDNKHDSGWKFLSGFEDEEYINNSDNFSLHDLESIVVLEPGIVKFLDCDEGSAFEKLTDSEVFTSVDIFD